MPRDKRPRSKPGSTSIGGEIHVATVLQVTEFDDDGSPRSFRLMRDDERVRIEGGENFWVVYAPREMSARKN